MAKGRPKALRGRAFVVVLAVALSPVIVVALAQLWGWEERSRMERAVAEAAEEAQQGGPAPRSPNRSDRAQANGGRTP